MVVATECADIGTKLADGKGAHAQIEFNIYKLIIVIVLAIKLIDHASMHEDELKAI